VSFALRKGKPANDVALLLPNDDVWASFKVTANSTTGVTTKTGFNTRGSNISLDESIPEFLGTEVVPQILDAGFNFDFIDADAIDKLGVSYPVLVLPNVERLPLATYQKIEQYAEHGGIVIATRRLPSTAPGFVNSEAESGQIQQISQRLFRGEHPPGHFVEDERQLGNTVASLAKPDMILSPKASQIGFIHRKLTSGDLYFVANTSNHALNVNARFRDSTKNAEWWDAFTGTLSRAENASKIELSLQPYESRLIFFTDSVSNKTPSSLADGNVKTLDLSSDWDLSFAGSTQSIHMNTLHSWSDDERFKYYSGQVTYTKTFDLPLEFTPGASGIVDFGEGTPVPIPNPLPTFNMRAYLEGPVREAADIYVNGAHAGVVWHPPYRIDVSRFMKAGRNELRIVVGNTAINTLAGCTLPDYRLLNDRYGERFVPQGMENLQPLPSGILDGVRLQIAPRH
jgi:hypothetical protein